MNITLPQNIGSVGRDILVPFIFASMHQATNDIIAMNSNWPIAKIEGFDLLAKYPVDITYAAIAISAIIK